MVAVNGSACRAVRNKIFNQLRGRLPLLLESGFSAWLDVVPRYKHLGAMVHVSGSQRDNVSFRLCQARVAFKEGKREVYAYRTIPLDRRVALFRANVLGTLLHGAGTWGLLNEGEYKIFHSGTMSLYRQVLAIPAADNQHWSSQDIQGSVNLPGPSVLLHVERLRFLSLLLRSGPDALWALVRHDDSYMEALRQACGWLHSWVRATCSLGHPLTAWDEWSRFITGAP